MFFSICLTIACFTLKLSAKIRRIVLLFCKMEYLAPNTREERVVKVVIRIVLNKAQQVLLGTPLQKAKPLFRNLFWYKSCE